MSRRYLLPLLTLKDNGGGGVAMAFVRRMVANGEFVTVLASDFHGTNAVGLPENAGIDFVIVPSLLKNRLAALISFYIYGFFFSLLKRPSLIYTHIATGLIPNFSGRRAHMLAQDIEYRFYSGLRRRVAKCVFSRLLSRCLLLVTSERLATYFRRSGYQIVFQGDVGISRVYIDARASGELPATARRNIDCLLIAKRGSHKRHDETVRVAESLANRGRNVMLIDQDPESAQRMAGKNLRVTEAVTAPEMRMLYLDTQVFVSLSRAEGYGLTPLEALAQGCQVVTTLTPSTMYLRHPALETITGSDALIERVTAAVEGRLAAPGMVAEGRSEFPAFAGPFMEDWASRACMAIRSTEAR